MMFVNLKSAALAASLTLATAPTFASNINDVLDDIDGHLYGNGINLLVKGYEKSRHKIEGKTIIFPYQDKKLGGSGKAKREEAYDKILKVICTGAIKTYAPRHGIQFVMVMSDWKGVRTSTIPVHLTDCSAAR